MQKSYSSDLAQPKIEVMRTSVRSDVDFVITFEELWGLFDAKEINPAEIEPSASLHNATAAGRGYAVAGGVAGAPKHVSRNTIRMYRFILNMQRVLQNVKDVDTRKGWQVKWMYDRRHGLSGRMHGWCRNKCTVCKSFQSIKELSCFFHRETSCKGTGRP